MYVKGRNTYDEFKTEALIRLVQTGKGGRYLKIICNKDPSTQHQKSKAWQEIASEWSKVSEKWKQF